MNDILPQHSASNARIPSDTFLHPTHYPFKESIDNEIRLLKEAYEYVEITNEQVVKVREDSRNSLNFGDAVEEILYKELAGYQGMIDAHKLTEDRIFDIFGEEDSEEAEQVKRKKVFESLFDSTNKTIYYFLK